MDEKDCWRVIQELDMINYKLGSLQELVSDSSNWTVDGLLEEPDVVSDLLDEIGIRIQALGTLKEKKELSNCLEELKDFLIQDYNRILFQDYDYEGDSFREEVEFVNNERQMSQGISEGSARPDDTLIHNETNLKEIEESVVELEKTLPENQPKYYLICFRQKLSNFISHVTKVVGEYEAICRLFEIECLEKKSKELEEKLHDYSFFLKWEQYTYPSAKPL